MFLYIFSVMLFYPGILCAAGDAEPSIPGTPQSSNQAAPKLISISKTDTQTSKKPLVADFLLAAIQLAQKGDDVLLRSFARVPGILVQPASKAQVFLIKTLLSYDADPNSRDKDGFTPLYIAVQHGHLEVAKILLDRGAAVDMGVKGFTPLANAIESGQVSIVAFLLERGAKPSLHVPCFQQIDDGKIIALQYVLYASHFLSQQEDAVSRQRYAQIVDLLKAAQSVAEQPVVPKIKRRKGQAEAQHRMIKRAESPDLWPATASSSSNAAAQLFS